MLARRAAAATQLKLQHFSSSPTKPVEEGKNSFIRKAVSFVLITVTGGVALSALDDLAIYHSCSRKAMEKVDTNQAIRDALGEPIEKGPWYNASLAVAHKRHSVSCTFPVSGPQGNGIIQLKAVKNKGDDDDDKDGWMSYLRDREWKILIMEALVHVPENEEKTRTFRITVSDDDLPSPSPPCTTFTHFPSSSGEPSTVDRAASKERWRFKFNSPSIQYISLSLSLSLCGLIWALPPPPPPLRLPPYPLPNRRGGGGGYSRSSSSLFRGGWGSGRDSNDDDGGDDNSFRRGGGGRGRRTENSSSWARASSRNSVGDDWLIGSRRSSSRPFSSRDSSSSRGGGSFGGACFVCGRSGHKASDCPSQS